MKVEVQEFSPIFPMLMNPNDFLPILLFSSLSTFIYTLHDSLLNLSVGCCQTKLFIFTFFIFTCFRSDFNFASMFHPDENCNDVIKLQSKLKERRLSFIKSINPGDDNWPAKMKKKKLSFITST